MFAICIFLPRHTTICFFWPRLLFEIFSLTPFTILSVRFSFFFFFFSQAIPHRVPIPAEAQTPRMSRIGFERMDSVLVADQGPNSCGGKHCQIPLDLRLLLRPMVLANNGKTPSHYWLADSPSINRPSRRPHRLAGESQQDRTGQCATAPADETEMAPREQNQTKRRPLYFLVHEH